MRSPIHSWCREAAGRLLRGLRRAVPAGALALGAAAAPAQTIDDVQVLPQGAEVVVRLGFNANVHVVQQAPIEPADIYQVSWEIVSADAGVSNQVTDEVRRLPAQVGLPAMTLTYPADRSKRVKQLQVVLAAKAALKVRQGPTSRAIDLVFAVAEAAAPVPAPTPAPMPAPAAAPAADRRHFTIALARLPLGAIDQVPVVPKQFQAHEVFTTTVEEAGTRLFELDLGFFASEAEAGAVLAELRARFPDARIVDLDRRNAAIAAARPPLPPDADEPPAPEAPRTPETDAVQARANDLMKRAREALAAHAYDDAVGLLNQLLLLPPNTHSKEAQEWIGVAWERAGDVAKARVEYELYLRLYPTGEGAERVAQRVASLEGTGGTTAAPAAATTTAASRYGRKITGDVAQYYYGGKARSQSLTTVAAGIDQSTLSKTVESALLTNVDLSVRQTDADSDLSGVVRGTNTVNLSSQSHAQSIMNAAYVDYQRTESGLGVRLGRQSAINGGLLGLFDGLSMTYPVAKSVKVDLMGGAPANPLLTVPQERLLAGMVEADNLFEHWGGDIYLLNQTTQGITNRRAVGAELRYSSESGSLYSLVDGDLLFHRLNAISLQGSYLAPGNVNVTLLLDSRNAPTLEMTNALISSGASSLKQLLLTKSLAEIRADALNTTARARQALLSVSRPFSPQWQLAADLRYSDIGALPAVGNFEATPATGAQVGGSLQLTGSNLYSAHDVNNFGVNLLSAPTFKGLQFSWSNLTSLRNRDWTLEPSLSWYTQHDDQGVHTTRADMGLRASYRLSAHTSLTEEGLFEHSQMRGPLGHDTTNSVFFYICYRYDFH